MAAAAAAVAVACLLHAAVCAVVECSSHDGAPLAGAAFAALSLQARSMPVDER